MDLCAKCGFRNRPEYQFCAQCGAPLTRESPEAEVGHIDYLLKEVLRWRAMGWIFESMADRISRYYRSRRAALQGRPAESAGAPRSVWSILESPTLNERRPPVQVASQADSDPSPWISQFLEAHWLKLLAALAAVLIFVGMRQVLGWEWVSTVAVAMIPLLPIGLCGALYTIGMKARAENALGAFAYQAVATVLSGFSLFAVNKHWLSGAVPEPITLAAAAVASTLMASITYRLTDDNGFLHLTLAGCIASLNTMLRALMPIPSDSADSAFVYCLANFGLAAAFMTGARFIAVPAAGDIRQKITLSWAHIAFSAGLLWMSLPAAAHGAAPENSAVLLFTASGLYVLASQAFGSAGMGYASGLFAAIAAAFLLNDLRQLDWYACGYSAVTLAGLTFALSRLRNADTADGRISPAKAFSDLSLIYSFAAAAALCMRALLSASGEAPDLTGSDWPAGAALGLLSAAALAVHARLTRIPLLAAAASMPAMIGLTLATDRLLAWCHIVPGHHLAHSLIPFILISGLAAARLLRTTEKSVDLPPYGIHVLWVTAAAGATGILSAIGDGLSAGPELALWTALSAYFAIGAAFARVLPDAVHPEFRTAAAGTAVACIVAMGGFAGRTLAPNLGIGLSGVTIGLTGWLLLASLHLVRDAAGPWSIPLRLGAGFASITGGLFAVFGSGASAELIALAAAINLALIAAAFAESDAREPAVFLSGALAAGAAIRLTFIAPVPGILFAMAAAGRFAFESVRLRCGTFAWLAAGALALGGVIGATQSAQANTIASELGILSFFLASGWTFWSAAAHNRSEFAYAAGAAFLAGYARLVWTLFQPEPEWLPLALLPALAALHAAGFALRERAESIVARPLRVLSTVSAVILAADSVLLGLNGGSRAGMTALTLGIYGLAFLVRAWVKPTGNWAALAAGTLQTACGFWLADSVVAHAVWAAAFGLVPLITILCALGVRDGELKRPLYILAAAGAAVTGIVALNWAADPGAGTYSVIALLESGAAFAGLAFLGSGILFSHAAFASWFAAYGLVLYDNLGIDVGVLDVYAIPLSVYLFGLSHFAVKRGESDSASALWWGALLALFAPTYLSFYHHYVTGGSPLHALLLLLECLGAIAWGITRRIRAYVLTGTAFSLAFAGTLASGIVVEIWTGLMAVIVGVTLLAFVFYVSLHQDAIRAWMQRFNREWSRWR